MSHDFVQRVAWQGGRDGSGQVETGGAQVPISVPAQFKGPGKGSNPEELLLAALGACFVITMGLIAVRTAPAVQRIEAEARELDARP